MNSRFLRRTVLATGVAVLVVASTAASAGNPAWGWRYLQAAVWSMIFFALTPLVIKYMVFEQRLLPGIALLAGKLAWMGLMFLLVSHWSAERVSQGELVVSTLAGVATPLAVVALRILGRLSVSPSRPRMEVQS